MILYIGTYTQPEDHVDGKGAGIYGYTMDPATGALALCSVTTGIVNPSFLAIDTPRSVLYAVSEMTTASGGFVYAYTIDRKSLALTFLNRQPSGGGAPCHVRTTGTHVLLVNYLGGSVAMLPVASDGSLAPASALVYHEGSSIHQDRQQSPHPHAVMPDPTHRFALVPDLGTDRIEVYRLKQNTLQPTEKGITLQPGVGPRHLTFHQNGHYVYLMNELNSTVAFFSYDANTGFLCIRQIIDALPSGYSGIRSGADIHAVDSYVYVSLRGPGMITQFEANMTTGHLACIGHTSTEGVTPRNFAIDPTGNFLLVANQDSDTVVTFRRDPVTGRLSGPVHIITIPSPVCIQFFG